MILSRGTNQNVPLEGVRNVPDTDMQSVLKSNAVLGMPSPYHADHAHRDVDTLTGSSQHRNLPADIEEEI